MQSTRIITLKDIDPTKMSPEEEKILGRYLLQNQQSHYFGLTATRSVNIKLDSGETVTYKFKLAKRIWFRTRSSDTEQLRFDVVESNLHANNLRKLDLLAGSLIPQLDGSVKFKYKPRVIKWVQALKGHDNEFRYTQRVKYLKAKSPRRTKIGEAYYTYQVMKYIKGGSLYNLFKSNTAISTQRRLEISIKLLRALAGLHALGIYHCDIKPDNLMVDTASSYACKIIDFGSSKTSDDKKALTGGSLGYSGIEQRSSKYGDEGTYTDAFSIGRTLAMLWKLSVKAKGNIYANFVDEHENLLHDSEYYSHGFNEINDLNQKQRAEIHYVIKELTKYLPNTRYTIAEAQNVFENILLEHILETGYFSPSQKKLMVEANNMGRKLVDDLLKISTNNLLDAMDKLKAYQLAFKKIYVPLDFIHSPVFETELFRVIGIKTFEAKSLREVNAILNEAEKIHRAEYFKAEMQAALRELAALEMDVIACKDFIDVTECQKEIFILKNNINAAFKKNRNPETLTEFLKETNKAKRKYAQFQQKLAAVKKHCKEVIFAQRDKPFEEFFSLSQKIETTLSFLSYYKENPLLASTCIKLSNIFHDLQDFVEHHFGLQNPLFSQDSALIKKMITLAQSNLPIFTATYHSILTEISQNLEKNTVRLSKTLNLFTRTAINTDRVKDITELVTSAASRHQHHTSDAELNHAYLLSAKAKEICREPLAHRFSGIFSQIDQVTESKHSILELQILRGKIKNAIEKYIYTTTTKFGLVFRLRAASSRRRNQMQAILDFTNSATSADELKKFITTYCSNFHGELAASLLHVVNKKTQRHTIREQSHAI